MITTEALTSEITRINNKIIDAAKTGRTADLRVLVERKDITERIRQELTNAEDPDDIDLQDRLADRLEQRDIDWPNPCEVGRLADVLRDLLPSNIDLAGHPNEHQYRALAAVLHSAGVRALP